MAVKVIASMEALGLTAVMAAPLAKDTIVRITGNATVNQANAGHTPVGRVSVPAKEAAGKGTVESFYTEIISIKGVGVCPAGTQVKLGVADGTTGENTAVPWDSGADLPTLILGLVWEGGTNTTLKVLVRK